MDNLQLINELKQLFVLVNELKQMIDNMSARVIILEEHMHKLRMRGNSAPPMHTRDEKYPSFRRTFNSMSAISEESTIPDFTQLNLHDMYY